MKKRIEIWLLEVIIWLLFSRDVARSPYINRRDNKALWGMGEQIEKMIERMKTNYKNV